MNFVGASRALEKDYKIFIKENRELLRTSREYQEISWQFIPAGAPHMGGFWESAVKS